jgi:hypothetical protein
MEWGLLVTIVLGVAGWGWAFLQRWEAQKARMPLMLIEPTRDERRPDRVHVAVAIRNRGPSDVYIQSVLLDEPALDMLMDIGPPIWFADDNNRPTAKGRELQLGLRLPPHSSGEFPMKAFSFWVDGVTSTTIRFCVSVIVSRKIDASARTSLRDCVNIQSPNRYTLP